MRNMDTAAREAHEFLRWTPNGRALSSSEEHGFLWRQNTYWSYEERDGGLYIQIESVSLTRSIPSGLGWVVGPFVESVPRESLEFTLRSACNALRKSMDRDAELHERKCSPGKRGHKDEYEIHHDEQPKRNFEPRAAVNQSLTASSRSVLCCGWPSVRQTGSARTSSRPGPQRADWRRNLLCMVALQSPRL